jgi:hypothetical protein
MTLIKLFTEDINKPLERFNQSGTYDFIIKDKSLNRKIFICNLAKTLNNNYCLTITNLNGVTRSFGTGDFGWDINSTDKISVALELNTNNIVFNIPDYLTEGFI